MLCGSLGLDFLGALMVAYVGRLNFWVLAAGYALGTKATYPLLYLLSELVDLSHLCGLRQ